MNTMEDTFKIPWPLKHNSRVLPEEVLTLYHQISNSKFFNKYVYEGNIWKLIKSYLILNKVW